jgi:hypothetical protein
MLELCIVFHEDKQMTKQSSSKTKFKNLIPALFFCELPLILFQVAEFDRVLCK